MMSALRQKVGTAPTLGSAAPAVNASPGEGSRDRQREAPYDAMSLTPGAMNMLTITRSRFETQFHQCALMFAVAVHYVGRFENATKRSAPSGTVLFSSGHPLTSFQSSARGRDRFSTL